MKKTSIHNSVLSPQTTPRDSWVIRFISIAVLIYPIFARGQSAEFSELETETTITGATWTRPAAFDGENYIELGASFEHLTNNYNNWNTQYVNVFVPMKSYGMVNFQADNVNRFHTRDQAFSLAYGYPFKYGILNFEGSYAANPNFLPETTAAVRWEGTLPAGFGYIVGGNQKQYAESFSNAYTNMLSLGAEKYIGDFRFAYIGGISTINKTESSYSQKLQAQWVGESKNQLGVAYTWGMIPTVIYLSNLGSYYVKYISLNGMYWLNKSTAITSALWHGAEGDYFQLNGAQLGLRYNF